MSSQSVFLHIQIIDHLDHDSSVSYDLSAHTNSSPRSYLYHENDDSTQVELILSDHSVSLTREGKWKTSIHFNTLGLGSFRILSELGEMRGEVKVLNSLIDADTIRLDYQLILDHSIITHQTLTYTIRGAQA